ncbi:Dopey protein [Gracilaria domingensis]|nr:Dopey protein [Gracilaria domingensis]
MHRSLLPAVFASEHITDPLRKSSVSSVRNVTMESEEEQQLIEKNSRQYAALRADLSAALSAFDRAQDWADLIHDLLRVIRILGKHEGHIFLPEKSLLAKRLAQCLTSFLPSGVHLKALETYQTVFKRIGPARLARDLPLYAGGLFPLFSHCSTTLKAPLLSLYETYFIPLGPALCPVLDGFILAILPGLEDEGSEFYGRSLTLLENVGRAVADQGIFARALWRALLVSPPTRFAAAHYLRSKLSGGDVELRAEMVSDMTLVAYAITAAVSDENALSQRNVLDLLMGELALNSAFFECKDAEEQGAAVSVMGGVFGALIKREVSLTKRVHAWLLGGQDGRAGEVFCSKYSKDLVLHALDLEVNASLRQLGGNVKILTKPCRIVGALLDRDEISDCLGHHFALRILKFGMKALAYGTGDHDHDLRGLIADLLQDIGSARVFGELERMLTADPERRQEDFELLTFALSMFPNQNEFVRREHLPVLLREVVNSVNVESTDLKTLDKAVVFCSGAVLAMGKASNRSMSSELASHIKDTIASFASVFVGWLAHAVEQAPVEVGRAYRDVSVADEYAAEMRMSAVYESQKEFVSLAKGACAFFKAVASSGFADRESLRLALQSTAKCASSADVRISLAGAKAFADIAAFMDRDELFAPESTEQILRVIRRCWRQMHPSLQTATAQSAQAFLSLQHRFPEEAKVTVADGILSSELSRRLRNLERFACLWRLAVEHRLLPLPSDDGLFLMLDALTDEDWGPKMLARSWLSDALEVDAASVLDAPLRLLLTREARNVGRAHDFKNVYDAPRALYGFQILRGILESCPTIMSSTHEGVYIFSSSPQVSKKDGKRGRTGIRALASSAPSPRTVQLLAQVFAIGQSLQERTSSSSGQTIDEGPVSLSLLLPADTYVTTIGITCLGYLRGNISPEFDSRSKIREATSDECANDPGKSSRMEDLEWVLAGLGIKSFRELHAGVCAAAAECLATLFTAIPVPSQLSATMSNAFARPVLNLVRKHIANPDPVLELHFMDVMTFLITADGPCYLSSIQGKDTFTKSDTGRIRLSFSEPQLQLGIARAPETSSVAVQPGAIESLEQFVPWILDGVSRTCRTNNVDHTSGSQEVLGVRRRWIRFIETGMRYVGASLPIIAEGLLLVLCEYLKVQNEVSADERFTGDSEFSRVDETLVLLEGIGVVSSNLLWSFEHALSSQELNDDASKPHGTLDPSGMIETAPRPDVYSVQHGNQQDPRVRTSENGYSGKSATSERPSNPVAATTSMISAMNPLRMINDFVKDVLSGSGSDGTLRLYDPRRGAARLLFCILPGLVENIAIVWGPSKEAQMVEGTRSKHHIANEDALPPSRLSTELPRERRQAQRSAVLSVLEPIFELRSMDVIAAVIALFTRELDEVGLTREAKANDPSKMAVHMLHAMDYATPDVVVNGVKSIYEKAVHWGAGSVDASEGRVQQAIRNKSLTAVKKLIASGSTEKLIAEELKSIGQNAPAGQASTLPGGSTGLDLNQAGFPLNGSFVGHQSLFHWGDYFAHFSSASIETACLNFLDCFLGTCSDGDDVLSAWPTLNNIFRESLASGRRKRNVPAVLRILGTYVSKHPSPFPDRRYKTEIMSRATMAIDSCGQIASGVADLSKEEHNDNDDFKRRLSVSALRTLASNVPVVIDSAFLDERPQVLTSTTSSLSPAVMVLRKAAARAVATRNATENRRRLRGSSSETNASPDQVETEACVAATDLILNISSRDWGTKHVRREMLALLEDPNFFYGKQGRVLENMSAIVREVVAGGGAGFLFSSICKSVSNGTPGLPSIFVGRDSETALRARAIRRLAYCVFVSEPDFYSLQLPTILERIRDALRMAEPLLVVECMTCLRALLLRTGASSVSAFRASTLSELFRIALNPMEDLNATLAALKFLDLITLLSPPDYGYDTCFFFGEKDLLTKASKGTHKPFEPLVRTIVSLWEEEDKCLEKIFHPPFRLKPGFTVFCGQTSVDVDNNFLGRYASALAVRNSLPKMKASPVETAAICGEFELEFLM